MTRPSPVIEPGELLSPDYFAEQSKGLGASAYRVLRDGLELTPRQVIEQTGLALEGLAPVREALKRLSQLGLKELWLGASPGAHNRWAHSVGTLNAGMIWLSAMEGDHRVPQHCMAWKWEEISSLTGLALLLHDYGHLPFTHLLNNVLQAMNWLPPAARSGGLETAVLPDRAREDLKDLWQEVKRRHWHHHSMTADDLRELTLELILGTYGLPWLQTIVNSSIDADKIDYLRFDNSLLGETMHPVRGRLQQFRVDQWLAEFLTDQTVNHAGLLCLHGRSAVAAADLWRERIFLYDRLYHSPEMRVAEAMAFEIVQQCVIRSTMSAGFRKRVGASLRVFAETFREGKNDPVLAKYDTVRHNMALLSQMIESADLEFGVLARMVDWLNSAPGIDFGYREFLNRCFSVLRKLQGKECNLREIAPRCLVREPLLLHRPDFATAREVLRPLQHTFCRETLIDLVSLPRVLATPHRWRTGSPESAGLGVDYSVLVPNGPVEAWGPNSRAVRPLTDECVTGLERPFARVLVVTPDEGNSPRARYVWDRVRQKLLDADIKLVKEEDAGAKTHLRDGLQDPSPQG